MSDILEKAFVFSVIFSKFKNEDEKYLKKKNQLRSKKFFGLIENIQFH